MNPRLIKRPGLAEKALYRKVESLMADLDSSWPLERLALALAPRLLEDQKEKLGIASVLVYSIRAGELTRVETFGESSGDLTEDLRRDLEESEDSGDFFDTPWTSLTPAGITGVIPMDEKASVLLLLIFGPPSARDPQKEIEETAILVASFHWAIMAELQRRELKGLYQEARAIQMSLLPHRQTHFHDYDIGAATLPALAVGGDFYDLIPIDDEALAIAIADATGHGLPAALQARDVATGLRMGVERDLKIKFTVGKLNRVIHQSGLSTRFVSLVFGELEANGTFLYINAGHPPPLLLDDRGVHRLDVGGMILGPDPETTYKLGYSHVDRGALLAFYTDGIVERTNDDDEVFGIGRIEAWLRDWREGPAEGAAHDLIERVQRFGDNSPLEDDLTVLVVRRPHDPSQ